MYSSDTYEAGLVFPWWGYVIVLAAFVWFLYLIYHNLRAKYIIKTQASLTRDWVMLRVVIPKEQHANEDDQRKNFQEMLSVVEPFYASINSLFSEEIKKRFIGQDHISVEIVSKEGKIYFYIG